MNSNFYFTFSTTQTQSFTAQGNIFLAQNLVGIVQKFPYIGIRFDF
jgi:hypothetical protein